MATIVSGNRVEQWPDTDPRVMAHDALKAAAEKIGLRAGGAQLAAHLKARRVRRTFRFNPPESQRTLVAAMPQVLSGELSPNDAMGLLWGYDVMVARGLRP